MTQTIQPFPANPYPDFPRDPTIDAQVKTIGRQFTQLAIGLIDLTPPMPSSGFPYGGVNDDVNINIGSGAKVAAMYPAFHLLQAATDALTGIAPASAVTGQSLIAQLSQQLQPLSGSPYWTRFRQDVPNLAKILDITPNASPAAFNVSFTSTPTSDLRPFHSDGGNYARVRTLGFQERMMLMICQSDNCASMSCIEDLGFQFINGLLARAGFFDTTTNIGLWLGASYGKGCMGQRVGLWQDVPGGHFANDSGFQVSSARMLAKFMGTLAQGLAVNTGSSGMMLAWMNKRMSWNHLGTRSFLGEAITGRTNLTFYSRLGIADFLSDAVVVERSSASGKMVKYVAVALRAPRSDTGLTMLHDLSQKLDALIESRHP